MSDMHPTVQDEIKALRALLAAISEAALAPRPANYEDFRKFADLQRDRAIQVKSVVDAALNPGREATWSAEGATSQLRSWLKAPVPYAVDAATEVADDA
jgi:hypothetical protein